MLEQKIIELAANIIYQSYNTISTEDAFFMAVGEAEVEFDTDIDMKFTNEFKTKIENIASQKL